MSRKLGARSSTAISICKSMLLNDFMISFLSLSVAGPFEFLRTINPLSDIAFVDQCRELVEYQ